MTYHSRALSLNGLAAEINLLDPDLPVSVAVTDLDGFGPLNAAHGTEAGDAVLGSFERSLAAGLPQGALLAHSRGDELAVARAERAAGRVRRHRGPAGARVHRRGTARGRRRGPGPGQARRRQPDRDPRRGAHDPEEQLLSAALAAPPHEIGPAGRAAGSEPAAGGAGRVPGPQSGAALAGK